MILGILFSSLKFSELWVCLINMDTRTQEPPKMHGPTTLPLGTEILKEQTQWTRCNSFSSCSNDSSMFCNSRPSQNLIFQSDKHLVNDGQHSSHLSKRNRNSSGSSLSSTVSSASDRDTKNTSVIITSTSLPQVVNTEIRTESLARLSCPEISPNGFNLQHEALLSCSSSPNSILPFRHNLRRNIRKKTCSCDCTTTCTTLVVRRYKEKNLEEETVISSTKVQSCIQNNDSQDIHNVSFDKSFSEKAENNRKRRSEVEKLYDSLHEIKWAKNFSPDNILRQLNIRQAASCSLFGRSPPNKSSSAFSKSSKKQKLDNDQLSNSSSYQSSNDWSSSTLNSQSSSPSDDKSTNPNISKTSSEKKKFNRITKNHIRTNLTLRSHLKNATASSKKIDTSQISTDTGKQSLSKSRKMFDSVKSTEKFRTTSAIKIKHNTSKNCIDSFKSTSIMHENCLEKREIQECPLFTKSDSSSSLPINYLLSLKGTSDIDCPNIVSDYPSTFYDIAEEGIRTIDACFREVGAEVVVSTCYEKDNELPRLTAVRDNVLDKGVPTDDGPPVLEPCVSLQDRVSLQNIECKVASDFPISNKSDAALKYMYEKEMHSSPKNEKIVFTQDTLQDSPLKIKNLNQEHSVKVFDKQHMNSVSRHVHNSLVKDACRKISNKYLKLLRSKSRTVSVKKRSKPTKLEENPSISTINRTVDSVIKNKPLYQDNSIAPHSSAISNFPFGTKGMSFRTSGEKAETTTILQTSNKRVSYSNCPESIAFNQSTSNSFMYSNNKESFSHVSTSSKNLSNQSVIVEESRTNVLHVQHTALPPVIVTTAYVPIKNAIKERKTLDEEVPRTPTASFTCHYQTIKVNRQNNYTQVQLKLNRGCSIFLTVETLTELKDVLRRTSQDTNCHILILNGIGDSFCLGLDLLPLLGPQKIKASTEIAVAVKEFIEELSSFKKPFVAVANGSAFGLGMTILNHADICIASDAAKFCLPQTSLGYFPEGGATLTMPQAVGSTMATDLILRGRTITAHEAKNIGLVSEVMEAKYLPYDLVNRVKMLAENSQTGMETAKAMLKMHMNVELLMVLENEVKLLPKMWLSRSCQEAIQNTSHTWLLAE